MHCLGQSTSESLHQDAAATIARLQSELDQQATLKDAEIKELKQVRALARACVWVCVCVCYRCIELMYVCLCMYVCVMYALT